MDKQFRIEKSPRWVRVQVGGDFVADSRNVLLVWDDHHIPQYFFPAHDVRQDFLQDTGRGGNGRTSYHLQIGEHTIPNAAWAYSEPDEKRAALKDYVVFRWQKMDAWYEEAEQVHVHARDPYTRVDAIASSRYVRVEIDGVTVAESSRPVLVFETNLPTRYYLPRVDVDMGLLMPTGSETECPYKGTAVYWSATINGQRYNDIVWSYPAPLPEQPLLKGLMSFYNEKVDIYVDGERQERPQTVWS